jgi:hypothetical protein
MAYPLQNLNISWDFAVDSKSSYFNSPVSISGDYCISFCDQLLPFYEICPLQNSQIYILEAVSEKPIFLNGATKPFVYIRNIGNYNINLCSAETGVGGLYFQYEKEKINNKNACSFSNYVIEPKQGLLLNLNIDQDGSAYFSSGEYPFGYFYNFSNLKNQNLCGLYPVCCINGAPIYRYNDLCNFNIDYIDCGDNNFAIEYSGTRRTYDAPNTSGNFLSLAIGDDEYLSIPSGGNGCNCFNIKSGNFNFQTWFKINCMSSGTGNTSVAYIDSAIPYNLLGFNKECIFVGSGDVVNKELCFSTTSICFNYNSPGFYGGIRNDQPNENFTVNTNDFTIDFFAKVDNINVASFFDFGTIKMHLGDSLNRTFWIASCTYNWQPNVYIKTGQWQHFAVSRCDNCIRIYTDSCCIFGVCNTGVFSGYCKSFIGYRDGYYTLNGCMYGFRFIKNQSLYTGNCIPRILAPLSVSGFINCNQNITGSVSYLGLQSGALDFGWGNRDPSYINTFCSAQLVCEIIESGFFVKTGIIENQWNHFSVDVYNCTGSIWINGDLKCIFSGFNNSGILMPDSGTNKLIIGNGLNLVNNFNGSLSYVQYMETSTSHPFGSNFLPCNSGFNNTGYSDLSLDFKWTYDPFDSYQEFSTCSLIDNELDLSLSFSGSCKHINSGICSYSQFGDNTYNYLINIKCIHLHCNDKFLCFIYPSGENFYSGFFQKIICEQTNLCLNYDFEFSSEKIYRFKYEYSGTSGDSNQNFVLVNNSTPCSIIEISGSCTIDANNEYSITGNSLDKFYVNFNLNSGYSIASLKNKNINRQDVYLPVCEIVPYNYCYEIADANYLFETGVSGKFVDCNYQFSTGEFINCSVLVSCLDQAYIDNQPADYYVCLNYCENRFCTNSILCKDNCDVSEYFVPIIGNFEKSYFYSGLEYKYYPVCCVLYKDLIYEIPESNINITLLVNDNSTVLDFPIQALSLDKLKIISNSEVYERLCNTNINLNYSGIDLNFNCCNLNSVCFKIPKINNSITSGLESPNFYLTSSYETKINDCVTLYLDPYNKFNLDRYYGLNNLLFFIASELNCGSIHVCDYCNFSYGSSDYNFLMIDLENEFYDCSHQIPSGSGSFIIDQKISCRSSSAIEPFAYKSRSGDGYAYVLPIVNCLQYSDCFIHFESGSICSERILNKNLNFITTGFSYIGGSTGELSVFFEDGQYSGVESGFLQNSNASIFQNQFSINIDSESIRQTEIGRILNFSKHYLFSGIQPIKFITNYPLLDIKDPIYSTNLMKYCEEVNETGLNKFYYFVYDLANFQEKSIKFLSPDFTSISSICWSDASGSRSVLNSDNFNADAKIQNNAGYVKYYAKNLINSNPYYLCFSDQNNICIDIRGGIL